MSKNESFRKKELNRKDYQKQDRAAKVVKGAAFAGVAAVVVPKIVKGIVNVGKKLLFQSKS